MTDRNTTIYPDKKELCIEDMVKGIGRKATDEELLDYLLKDSSVNPVSLEIAFVNYSKT